MRFLFAIATLLAVSVGVTAQSKDEQALIQLEHDWAAAYLRHDTATIMRILGDDFVGIDGRGVVTNKAQELEEAKGTSTSDSPSNFVIIDDQIIDMKVRLYGGFGIVNGISVERVKMKDREATIRFRRTTVWVRRNNRWQCVSFHGSRILEAPATQQPQNLSTP